MNRPSYLVKPLDGYSPRIGELVSMMTYVRYTTWQAVKGLSVAELDYLAHPEANSIGMLLEHMAAVEVYYGLNTFEERDLNEKELERWRAGLELGEYGRKTIRGREVEHYLGQLESIRTHTLANLAQRDDDWLLAEADFYGDQTNTYWKWFHVFEDEVSHRGQIRLIKKLYAQSG